jgi:hypothetical protein
MDRRFAGRSTSCQRRAIFFSPLQEYTRHAFPLPANGQYHHQPYHFCFAPVEYWQNSPQTFDRQASPVDRPAVDWNPVVLKIALRQPHCKIQAPNPATPYEQFSSYFGSTGKCDACHFILNGAVRNSALAGRVGRP